MKGNQKILACLIILVCCGPVGRAQERLSPKEFRKKLALTTGALLLDVRTPPEISKGYLKGAVFMDFYDSSFRQQLMNLDRNRPVFVYCAIGGRSWDAAKLMSGMGFKEVYDLKGGIIVWKIKSYDYIRLKKDTARQGMSRQDFEKMITGQPLSFVDFYAPWCLPCKIMVPALDRIEQEMKDTALVIKINADENLQLMREYGLKALPYILIFKYGTVIFRQEGFMSEEDMKGVIRKYSTR